MALPAGTPQEHRYQLCRDEDCERFPCRLYKEGRRDGIEEGYRRGWDDCYPVAFSDGIAACPRPHAPGG